MAKNIMVQGTGSSVGKSLIVAGLCRIIKSAGYKVAPFKAQNMSLNSYITAEGGEMGRAQVVQAEASGIEPSVLMNPILIKPTGDMSSQVIVLGKVYRQLGAEEYYKVVPELVETVRRAYQELAAQYDVIVLEGAGSPAEINLYHRDVVNMGMARMVDAPVVLVGDIEKGGVFASIFGTVSLLPEEDRKRVKGWVINKFRGSLPILEPGIKDLERMMGIPCLGVIPHVKLALDEEDGAIELLDNRTAIPVFRTDETGQNTVVAVIRLPHISNFTDFDVFAHLPDTSVVYANHPSQLENADIVILPGSKNTIGDLTYLENAGFVEAIMRHYCEGGFIIGVCGGYQMLGKEIHDPHHTESRQEKIKGLGLLDIVTVFAPQKTTAQVQGHFLPSGCPWTKKLARRHFRGYEIHMGVSHLGPEARPLLCCVKNDGSLYEDGTFSTDGRVLGSYVHGLFDDPVIAAEIVNHVRRSRGWQEISCGSLDYRSAKEREYQRWADIVAASLDMDRVFELIFRR
ncbi:MAG: cobyric acid synthase [Syntrophothermus sp.]|nr:cobyric acid synthase [Syntrophothermus sp.]